MILKNIKEPIWCDVKASRVEAHVENNGSSEIDIYVYDQDQPELSDHLRDRRYRYIYCHTEVK